MKVLKPAENHLSDDTGDRLDFELLLKNISNSFMNLSLEAIDETIEKALKDLCGSFGLERSVLWLSDEHDASKLKGRYCYDATGALQQNNTLAAGVDLPWIVGQLSLKKRIHLDSLEHLPKEAGRDRRVLKDLGIKSILMIIVSIGDRVFGALSFCCLQKENTWRESLKRRLPFFANIFANALACKEREKETRDRLRFESLLVDISSRFVSLKAEQVDAQIENAQKEICQCLGIDLSALWQWSDESPHFMTISHLYSPPEGPDRPDGIDARETFPWMLNRILKGERVVVVTETMPPEARLDQESRRFFGMKSSVCIPLCDGADEIIGILTFDDLKRNRSWPELIQERLSLVAQIFTNVLSRRRFELKLKENERRLRLATSAGKIGLWVMDLNSRFVWVTPKLRDIFRFEPDALLNYNSFMEKIIPEDREMVEQAVKAAVSSGGSLEVEYRADIPDKGLRWIKAAGKVYHRETGGPDKLMGVFIDVTRHRRNEEKLKSQFEEIQQLKQALEAENVSLRKEIEIQYVHEEIIARSPEMKQILSQVEQVAQTDTTVLVEGETGTGKELIARAVHRLSLRGDRPLVSINCASLPPALVESELFGREKGAYTGALTRMTGRFEAADKATLFLDEVGELPLEIQAKLLRVLEQGSFERLGSTQTVTVDVRIIAATNQNLEKLVAEGKIRKDLYFRLNIFPIHLPPLRYRIEDIPPLVWAFIREYEKKMGKRIDHISKKNMEALQQYYWPGNIRELRNLIERSLITAVGRTLDIRPPSPKHEDAQDNITLEEIERRHIISVLEKTGWRISGKGSAAQILGLKRTTLQSKMKKLDIQRP